MRQLKMKNNFMRLFVIVFAVFAAMSASAQTYNKYMYSDLERLEDENMDYLNQIYTIVKDYPSFAYSFTFEDGEVKDVVVEGVDNNLDRKRLEVVLFDLNANKNKMKNKSNRIGVFYSVDEKAEYAKGMEALKKDILTNLEYPDEIKNRGIEGTVFVKFVVDENGEIPFLTTSNNIDSDMDVFIDRLEEKAAEAVKMTSGEWKPSHVEGEEVASMVVVPVTFDFKQDPFLPKMIH